MTDLGSSPLTAGLALLGIGALLQWLKPGAFDLPKPPRRTGDSPMLPRNRRDVRDGIASAMPDNLSGALARTCIIVGSGLLVLRALDEFMDEQDRLFAPENMKELS